MPLAAICSTAGMVGWVYVIYSQLGKQAELMLAEELGTDTDSILTVRSMKFMQQHMLITYPAFPVAVTLAAAGMISVLQLELFVFVGELLGTVSSLPATVNQHAVRL